MTEKITILDDLYKNGKVERESNNKAKTIAITFKKLVEIVNSGILVNPIIQVALDEKKVDDICNTWLKHQEFILTERPLLILVFEHEKNKKMENEYILVDGQHKLNAAVKLSNEKNIEDSLTVTFMKIDDTKKIDVLFEIINTDSQKVGKWIFTNHFKRKFLTTMKKQMMEKYKGCYAEKIKPQILTIDQFFDKLEEHGFLKEYDEPDENTEMPQMEILMEKLDECNAKFYKDKNYLENAMNEKDDFYEDEKQILKKFKNCMFLKRNNFCEYYCACLCNEKIDVKHTHKSVRSTISVQLKTQVWQNEFGESRRGTCPVKGCTQDIRRGDFRCGHIISLFNQGVSSLNNLRPICANCNHIMGTRNWPEYEKSKIFEDQQKQCAACKKSEKIENLNFKNQTDINLYCESCLVQKEKTKRIQKNSKN